MSLTQCHTVTTQGWNGSVEVELAKKPHSTILKRDAKHDPPADENPWPLDAWDISQFVRYPSRGASGQQPDC